MKVLVTGGTGFVGTHVVNALRRRGHEVAVLARRPDRTRNRYNRPVENVRGDVLDPSSLVPAIAGRDAVIHLVGIIHEKGPQTFSAFVKDGLTGGYEAALRKHYGIQSFDELEQRWRKHTFADGDLSSASKR